MAHTVRTINTALLSMGFSAQSEEALRDISAACRDRFLAAIDACLDKSDAALASDRELVRNVLLAVAPDTRANLAAAELSLSSETLIRLAIEWPQRFMSALELLPLPEHPKRPKALVFLAAFQAKLPTTALPVDKPAQAPATPAPSEFRSEHVYGANHALCWNAILGKDGVPGIMLDAANSKGSGYEWAHACHLWLNISEVMAIYAVLRRASPKCEFRGHGARHDKGFTLEPQKQGLFCRVADGRTLYGVRILPADTTRIAVICFEQMIRAYPHMPPAELSALSIEMAREAVETAAI